MATARPNRSRARRTKVRETFFPGSSAYIWPQGDEEGWARVPRNIGLVLAIIDDIKGKGVDVTRTYLDIFAHNLGEGIVEVHHELDFALRAGLSTGDRGVRSWEERLEVLDALGFIKLHRGATGRVEFIVLVHPRKAVKKLHREGKVKAELWNSYLQSLLDFDPDKTDENESMEVVPQQVPPSTPTHEPSPSVKPGLLHQLIHANDGLSTTENAMPATSEKAALSSTAPTPPAMTYRLARPLLRRRTKAKDTSAKDQT